MLKLLVNLAEELTRHRVDSKGEMEDRERERGRDRVSKTELQIN